MKTDLFFEDIKNRDNIFIIENVDNKVKEKFEKKYSKYRGKFFYEQFTRCGGIIIDNWIRLYGCGELNDVLKNEKYNSSNSVDILIGEDILGGLFGLKDDYVYYFAPDTNEWENMEIYYTQFIDWLINKTDDVNKFYGLYRWNNWKEDCKILKLTEGYHFYPLLQSNCDIEKRDKKIVPIDELISFSLNFSIEKKVNQIDNKELKEELLDNALAFLVNTNELEPKDFEGIKAEFGYILMLKEHGLEALFKVIKNDKIYYFAVQQEKLKLLDITEEQFQSVTTHMLDLHVNNK